MPLTCQKEFLLFYMCQLWALHVVIKTIFYIYSVCRLKKCLDGKKQMHYLGLITVKVAYSVVLPALPLLVC